ASPIGQNKTKGSKAMKKIGITSYPTVGGSGVIATELGVLLAKSGYEVHFITSSLPFRLDRIYPSIYYHEVSMSHYPVFQYPPYDLALESKMAEVIDREKLDILHVHYAMPHAISAILAKQIAELDVKIVTKLNVSNITDLRINKKKLIILHVNNSITHAISAILDKKIDERDVKIVTTLHGTDITVLGIDNTFKEMIKYGIEHSDAVTAVSHDLVRQTKERLN